MPTPQERDNSSNQTGSQPPSPTGGGTSSQTEALTLTREELRRIQGEMRRAALENQQRWYNDPFQASPPSISPTLSGTAPQRGSQSGTGRRLQRVRLGGMVIDAPVLTPSEIALLQGTPSSSSTPEKQSTSSSTPSMSGMDQGSPAGSPSAESTRPPDGFIPMTWRWDENLGQAVGHVVPTREAGSYSSTHEHVVPNPMPASPPRSVGSSGTVDPLAMYDEEQEQRAQEMRETLRELVNDYTQAPDGDL